MRPAQEPHLRARVAAALLAADCADSGVVVVVVGVLLEVVTVVNGASSWSGHDCRNPSRMPSALAVEAAGSVGSVSRTKLSNRQS